MYQTEKTLKDYGDKVSGDEKASIEAAITSLKDALTGSDQDKIKAGTEELERVSFKLAEAMYQQPSSGAPESDSDAPTSGNSSKPSDDVIDVDFKASDDKKK